MPRRRRAAALGAHLAERLAALLDAGRVTEVRSIGLWAGVDLDEAHGTGRAVAERLMARGVLLKDTHGQTLRIAPPVVITESDLDLALDALTAELT